MHSSSVRELNSCRMIAILPKSVRLLQVVAILLFLSLVYFCVAVVGTIRSTAHEQLMRKERFLRRVFAKERFGERSFRVEILDKMIPRLSKVSAGFLQFLQLCLGDLKAGGKLSRSVAKCIDRPLVHGWKLKETDGEVVTEDVEMGTISEARKVEFRCRFERGLRLPQVCFAT